MTIQTRLVEYACDGVVLEAFCAWDDALTGARPGIAIAHTWAGRGDFEEGKAIALAELGYVGFALDMYGKGVRGSNPEENNALMTPLVSDRELLQARMLAALASLRDQAEVNAGNVAAIGYCFGGLCALDLARTGSDVNAVISFHGLFMPPGNTADNRISAKVLCLHGYADPMAPPEAMTALGAELTAAGADWQIHAYGNTLHAFTNPEAADPEMGTVYNAAADRRSWQSLQNFLAELF
ncbi:MAG: dienelactone hydrolase family protein [Halioglobus sp.]